MWSRNNQMVFCTRNAEKYFLVSLCFCKKKNLLKKYSNFLVLSFSLQTKPKKMMVECAFFLVILSIRSFFFHRLLECWSKSRTLDNYVSCMAAKRRRRKKKTGKIDGRMVSHASGCCHCNQQHTHNRLAAHLISGRSSG